MRLLLALLVLLVMSSASLADHPAPLVLEGGINYFLQGECQDNETGAIGYCYMGTTADGRTIMAFWQNDELMFIRQVVGDGYETIWVAHSFNAV